MIDVDMSAEYMKEYKKFINYGIDCGQMGVAYYRVAQTEYNDFTHLEELRNEDDVKFEVLEMFVKQLLNSHNVMCDFVIPRDKNSIKNVIFDNKNYGSVKE